MKKCINCNIVKPLSDFYKHSGMKDKHLNKCKYCCRKYTKCKLEENMKNPYFAAKEKARHLEKDRRLYRTTKKPIREMLPRVHNETWRNHYAKYPEKYKARMVAQNEVPCIKGNELHHWSYKIEHAKSLIEMSKQDHYEAHKSLVYNQNEMCYETIDGFLLDTKEKHIEFLNSILIEFY